MNAQSIARSLLPLTAVLVLAACSRDKPQELIQDGKAALAKRDFQTASIQFKNALQSNPASTETRVLLGRSLLGRGENAPAIVEFTKALEGGGSTDEITPLIAKAILQSGDFKKAVGTYGKTVLKDKSAQAQLQTLMSTAWAALGEPEKSKASLEAALNLAPDYAPAILLQARQTASKGDIAGALALIDKQLAKDATLDDAWVLKGDLQSQKPEGAKLAQESYRKALQLDATNSSANFALMNLLLRTKDFAGAKSQLEVLKTNLPKSPVTNYVEAQIALTDGNLAKAREIAQQLRLKAPDNAVILQLSGSVALQMREYVQAESFYSKALQIAPAAVTARQGLGKVYLRLGRPAKALEALKPILEYPAEVFDAPAVYALIGEAELALGDAGAAEKYFGLAAKVDPDNAWIKTSLAMTRMTKGDTAVAFSELADVASNSKEIVAEQSAFSSRLRRREFDEALVIADQIAKKKPQSYISHAMRGQFFLARRDYVQARKEFENQLKADPGSFDATMKLAGLDIVENKPVEAKKRLQAAIKDDPKNVYAAIALARLLLTTEAGLDEAKQVLKNAIQASPQEVEPRLQLIALTLRKRQYKEALSFAREASSAMPNNLAVMDAVGRAEMEAGDVEQAIRTFRKMAGADERSALAYTRLSDIYKSTGKRDQAAVALKKALEIEPSVLPTQVAYVQLLTDLDRKAEALEYAKRLQRDAPTNPSGYNLEAALHIYLKAIDPAIAALRAGVAKTDDEHLALSLYRLLTRAGKAEEGDRFAASWLKSHPKDSNFSYQVAEFAMDRRQFDQAQARLLSLQAEQPDSVLILNNLATVMVLSGKPGAIDFAQKAVDLRPDDGRVLDTLASALAQAGQFDKALIIQKQAVELAPGIEPLHLRLAQIAIKANDKVLARTELTRLQGLGAKFKAQDEVTRLLKTL
jgi:putative PEP-CTERM system TPR-repeat lipoprotein